MDLADLILLLVFAGFPLLQFILERLGGKRQPPPPPDIEPRDDAELLPPLPQRPEVPRATLPPAAEDRWSEGADAWRAETLETLASEEVLSEREANELLAMQQRAASLQLPEATRVHLPVVSLESLQVDRKAEHGRFHATLKASTTPAPRAPASLRPGLRSHAELRKAIILAELLGPPKSLQ